MFVRKFPFMKSCRICDTKTKSVFNIDFKMTHICEPCAEAIFLQQAHWYAHKERLKRTKAEMKSIKNVIER